MKKNNQTGVSLLLTILVMAAILTIAVAVSRLSVGEIRLSRESVNSLVAFYAGESGVERALWEDRVNGMATTSEYTIDWVYLDSPTNDIGYRVETSIDPVTLQRVIQSTGSYRTTLREVEAIY